MVRQCRHAIDLPLCEAIFNGDIPPLDESLLIQPLAKCGHDARRISRAPLAEVANHWHAHVLRLTGERREYQAEHENDRKTDPPHRHLGGDGWRESTLPIC